MISVCRSCLPPRLYSPRSLLLAVTAVLPLTAAGGAAAQVLLDWRFDRPDRAGTSINDASRYDRDLKLNGDLKRDGGDVVQFDGRSTWGVGPTFASLELAPEPRDKRLLDGQAVRVRNDAPAAGFELAAKFRPMQLQGEQVILECYETRGDQRAFQLKLVDDRLVFAFNADGTWRGELAGGLRSEQKLKAGVWNEVKITFDGRYVGMNLNGTQDTARAFCPAIFAADQPLQVGRHYDGKEGSAYFHGGIASISLRRVPATAPGNPPQAERGPGWRNNLVKDLLALESPSSGEHRITLEHGGWVHVELEDSKAEATCAINGEEVVLDEQTSFQAMRRMPAGEHTLELTLPAGETTGRLTVRRVPDMVYIKAGYGPFAWDFLARNVLTDANVVVSAPPPVKVTTGSATWFLPQRFAEINNQRMHGIEEARAAWTDAGRDWLVEVPSDYWSEDVSWRGVLPRWRAGYEGDLGGTIVDEFGYYYDVKAYEAWSENIDDLYAESPDRRFFAYAFGLERFPSNHVFLQKVAEHDGRFLWEIYMREEPDEAAAKQALQEKLIQPMSIVDELMPWLKSKIIFCPSIWTGAGSYDDDFFPEVDQKVFLDMQFQVFATHPLFEGVAGFGPWTSGYASPEMIRWVGALYRHYGIEGNTDLLSARHGYTYRLPHLRGAGFEDPADVNLEPAATGSLLVRRVADLPAPIAAPDSSMVQPHGEFCLQFDHSNVAPNRARQYATQLKDGELYSVQFEAFDLDDPAERPEQPIPMTLSIDGGELVGELEERSVIYSPRTGHSPVFITRYSYVFRAGADQVELALSDWSGPGPDPAREGKRVIVDNLAVQPFFAEGL